MIDIYHEVGGNYAYKPMQNNIKSSQLIIHLRWGRAQRASQ